MRTWKRQLTPKEAAKKRAEAAKRRAEEARKRYFLRLRDAVRERREGLVMDAVLRGHRDVEAICWKTGLEAGQVRRLVRGLVRRHRADSLESAVRIEAAVRRRR